MVDIDISEFYVHGAPTIHIFAWIYQEIEQRGAMQREEIKETCDRLSGSFDCLTDDNSSTENDFPISHFIEGIENGQPFQCVVLKLIGNHLSNAY